MISPAVVLIVDDDLGFVVWLGVSLAAKGYATLPATSASGAQALIAELRVSPDMAMVNLKLAGTIELIKAQHRANPALKVIAIEDFSPSARRIAIDAAHFPIGNRLASDCETSAGLRNATVVS